MRHGTTDKITVSAVERFWSMVNKDGPVHPVCGQCWVWIGGNSRGYGRFVDGNGKQVIAHRWSWEHHVGQLESSEVFVLHRCDNPSCINPKHLFIGSHADNVADRDSKGRQVRGERQHKARLTVKLVRQIRSDYIKDSSTHGSTALAREYGVSHQTILRVIKDHCWHHVK